MKRFVFTLYRMLRFKQTMYERERSVLAKLRADRLAVERRRDATVRQMMAADAEYRRKAAVGMAVGEIAKFSYLRENAEKLVEELETTMADMDVEIEKQLQIVMELDREVQVLEKLRDKQWEEYQAESRREESVRILEMVSRRFFDDTQETAAEEAEALQKAAN